MDVSYIKAKIDEAHVAASGDVSYVKATALTQYEKAQLEAVVDYLDLNHFFRNATTVVEAIHLVLTFLRHVPETISTTDTPPVFAVAKGLAESTAVVDALVLAMTWASTFGETTSVSESLANAFAKGTAETVTVAELVTIFNGVALAASETVAAVDAGTLTFNDYSVDCFAEDYVFNTAAFT